MKKRLLFILLLAALMILPCVAASAATSYYVSGTSAVKLRQLPSTDSLVLASYRRDFATVSYKKYDSNWAYVFFSDGHEGYVMTKYLKSSSSYTGYITTDKTALRSGPEKTYSSLVSLSRGDKLTVLTTGSNWCYVSSEKYGTGYVSKTYISKKKIKPTANVPYTAYVVNPNNRSVNVRRGPGKGYAVEGALDPGTMVEVQSVGTNWSKIYCSNIGLSGYMMNQYLSKKAPKVTPTPSAAPTFAPIPTPEPFINYTAYIVSENGKSVNVRQGAGEGYGIIGSLKYGVSVIVVEHTNKNWARIYASGTYGYVMRKFLSTEVPGPITPSTTAIPTILTSTGYIYATDGERVNVRGGPGTGYDPVLQLEAGSTVTVIEDSTTPGWTHIEYGTVRGYVMSRYITATHPGTISGTTPGSETPVPSGFPYTGYVTSENGKPVNIRSGAGKGYNALTQFNVGTAVNVIGKEGSKWLHITCGAVDGYIMTEFISTTYVAPLTPTGPSSPSEGSPASIASGTAVVSTANGKPVNMRRGPGKGYSNVARVANGETVVLISNYNNTWAYVRYGSLYGYIMREFLIQ